MGAWRVEGTLAVSRSLGDAHMGTALSPLPHCARVRLTQNDAFVVLASDSLFDVMPMADVSGDFAGRTFFSLLWCRCARLCQRGVQPPVNVQRPHGRWWTRRCDGKPLTTFGARKPDELPRLTCVCVQCGDFVLA